MLHAQSMRGFHAVQAAQRGPSRAESLRALSILERLAAMDDHSPSRALVMQLSEALLPILVTSTGSGRKRTRGDDAAMLRVLGVLAAIWAKAAESSAQGMHCQLGIADVVCMKKLRSSSLHRVAEVGLLQQSRPSTCQQ